MNQNDKPINWHITEYLDYYCGLPQAPEFAVLLKGQWGSGKTWFINNYCEGSKTNQKKCLYVSLYGMTSFSEIEYEFFRQLNPVLASPGVKLAGKIIKGLIKGTLKIDFDGDGKDDGTASIGIPDINLPDYLKNIDGSILIFDDLERCNIEISSLLGYINNFVEYQDFKVILVANEDELVKKSDSLKNSYQIIKEKLIGKTFNVLPDFSSALKEFINELSDSNLKDFLKNTELIKDLYEQAKYNNLRTLKQIILDFNRISDVLPDKAKKKSDLLQELLKFVTIFSIEIRRGRILAKDIHEFGYEQISRKYKNEDTKDKSKEQQIREQIVETYTMISFSNSFPSSKWWQDFFDLGIVESQELQQSIENNFFEDENAPNWVKLWHFTRLSDDEFEYFLKEVKLEFAERKHYDLDIIKHIAGIFFDFSELKFYCKTKESILEDTKNYINDLKENKKIPAKLSRKSEDIFNDNYEGLMFRGRDIKEFQDLLSYIDEVQEQVNIEAMPSRAEKLLSIMQSNVGNFKKMITLNNDSDSIYCNIPILKYIEPNDFITKLLTMNYEDQLRVFWNLSDRYKFDSINNEKLFLEIDWLKAIRDLLADRANQEQGKISKYKLEELKKYLENEVINKLESSQAKNTDTTLNEE
ncbi:P-loop NTPase fold protein [Spirulina sp. 06S082]|uniref:P-loop NTPase fold protein n=1 Tax=Spirulina sp. 06S082 TaxID=3110248 RepID=UPI002B212863|nr:P-loop NTPase fold protein [Spirulina sp. 06S082]MEA5471941.1 P-loop NTPase fold protein [Spirulina sp. 06S082]